MALWVPLAKTLTFSTVKNKYKRTSQYVKAVLAEARGTAAWARWKTGTRGNLNVEVDVAAITLVRPLTAGGAIK